MIAVAVLLLRQDSADEPWMWTRDAENAKLESATPESDVARLERLPRNTSEKVARKRWGLLSVAPSTKEKFHCPQNC